MQAAQKGDTDRAAEYLQLPRQEGEVDSTRLVQDLKALLDHAFAGRLAAITDSPELIYDPQLEPNHERVGDFDGERPGVAAAGGARVRRQQRTHLADQLEHPGQDRRPGQ